MLCPPVEGGGISLDGKIHMGTLPILLSPAWLDPLPVLSHKQRNDMVIVAVFERLKSRCCCCYEISLLMEKEVCGCML